MIKAILFDMDGVLVNTSEIVWKTHNLALKEYEKHVSDLDVPRYLGKRLIEQAELLISDFSLPITANQYLENFLKNKINETERIKKSPELVRLIKSLKDSGLKLALATSSRRDRALRLMKHIEIDLFFDIFVTAEDVKIGKPNPEGYLKAAERLGIPPNECMIVEDALNGIEAAKNAGIKVIAIETHFLKRDDLREADYVISSLQEIPEILRNDGHES